MGKLPPLKEMYPKFAEEFERTKPPSVLERVTPEPPPPPSVCLPRPEGWWRQPPYSKWIQDRGREPTAYELMLDFIIGRAISSPKAMELAASAPSRLIVYEIEHPKRGTEFVRMFLNPTQVVEGPPEEEPDLWIKMNYYDFVPVLGGEISVFNAIYEGRATILGNTTAGLDQYDVMTAILGFEIPRPRCWPRGHP